MTTGNGKYAASSTVTTDRSRSEIETTLTRYGATSFMYGWEDSRAMIGFAIGGRMYRFLLPMPDRQDRAFLYTPAGRIKRTPKEAEAAYQQGVRQRWRALALVIKAKLEAVSSGITTIQDEFLPYLMLPNKTTVAEWLHPQIDEIYSTQTMPMLLPAPKEDNNG